ncbi:MAG: DUF2834 domain-containing protein [Bradymonadia bacterium]
MKHLYLALAVLGTVVPLAIFAPWFTTHGLDVPLLVQEMFSTTVSSFFSTDLIISALVVFVLVGRGMRRGIPHVWLAALGTVSVGVSLGLPLYLYLEARHEETVSEGG